MPSALRPLSGFESDRYYALRRFLRISKIPGTLIWRRYLESKKAKPLPFWRRPFETLFRQRENARFNLFVATLARCIRHGVLADGHLSVGGARTAHIHLARSNAVRTISEVFRRGRMKDVH